MTDNASSFDFGPLTSLPPRLFETERLRLRALEEQDAKLLFDLYASDPDTCRYMSFKCTGRIEETAAFVRESVRFSKGEKSSVRHFAWVITLKAGGEPIGTVGVGPTNGHALSGGYVLNHRFWGQGYASEAFKCILDWAKTQAGVYRVEALHDIENPASGRVMEKAGMKFEGVLRHYPIHPNAGSEPRDAAIYAWAKD